MDMRVIEIEILPDGSIKINNSQNSNETLILEELSKLSEALNGNPEGFKVEEHTHSHDGHSHSHIHLGGTH